MGNDDRASGERRAAGPRSNLFTVRLWKEEAAGGSEYRGSVQDVISGAFRSFRNWTDLAAFIIQRVEEDAFWPERATGTDEVRKKGRRR